MSQSDNDPKPTVAPVTSKPASPAAPAVPAQIVIKQNSVGRFLSWLGWMGFLLCIPVILGMSSAYQEYFNTAAGLTEKYHSLSKTAKEKIAIIRVAGTIMESEGFAKKQIDQVRKDEQVKAVVLRVNSPGGSVSASDYLLHHLNELREDRELPVVVSMGGLAASGGYYVSMAVGDQEESIFAEPTTTTGSIGVIIPHYDLSGLLDEFGVKDDSFVSHRRKQILSMTRPAKEEDRQVIQDYLTQAFDRFKEVVKSGRPAFREDAHRLDEVATGEIFSAAKAKALGLVDEIGFVEDAIARAAELAGLSTDSVRVVRYQQPRTVMDSLGLAKTSANTSLVEAVMDMSTPQAYYVWTLLPGMKN